MRFCWIGTQYTMPYSQKYTPLQCFFSNFAGWVYFKKCTKENVLHNGIIISIGNIRRALASRWLSKPNTKYAFIHFISFSYLFWYSKHTRKSLLSFNFIFVGTYFRGANSVEKVHPFFLLVPWKKSHSKLANCEIRECLSKAKISALKINQRSD